MNKILFFDIDGTLAHPGQSPSPATISAIRQARSNGHKAFLSTGRTMDSIPGPVAEIGFDGGIFSSGAVVMCGDQLIAQHFMPDDLVQKILSTLVREGALFSLETAEGRFNRENGADLLSQIDPSGVRSEMMQLAHDVLLDTTAIPYSKYNGQPVYKIAYYSVHHSLPDLLCSELGELVKVVPFNNIPGFPLAMGEISDPSITKGRALQEICDHLIVPIAATIAFGDSMNDAEILSVAGMGVAMGNADPVLKEQADMICDRCENDGIAKTLDLLKLV